jgi:hypothetical protein
MAGEVVVGLLGAARSAIHRSENDAAAQLP